MLNQNSRSYGAFQSIQRRVRHNRRRPDSDSGVFDGLQDILCRLIAAPAGLVDICTPTGGRGPASISSGVAVQAYEQIQVFDGVCDGTPPRKADFLTASPGHGDGNAMSLQDALNAFPHVQGKLMFIISPVRAFIGEVSRVMARVQDYLLLFHSCLPFLEIDQNQIMHISAALDGLAFEITLAGAAAVQHNGGIPSCRRQIVSEGLRRPGHTPAVSRTVQGQRAALDADSGASPLSSLALVINQFGDWLSGNNQRCAGDIITLRGIRQRVHRDVRSLIPGVAEDCVIRFAEYLPICFQVAVGPERGHVVERAVEDVIRPGLPLNLRERPESGVDVKLDAPDVFQGDCYRQMVRHFHHSPAA